jgi:hypothetical protein
MGNNTNRLTPEELKKKFDEYIIFCTENNKFANIAGFSLFSNIGRKTYYDYMELHEEQFSHTINQINRGLEDYVLNFTKDSPALRIFYLKNKNGYVDKIENVNINTNMNYNNDIKQLSNEELEIEIAKLTIIEGNSNKVSNKLLE